MWTLASWFIQTATVTGTTVSFTPFPDPGQNVYDTLVAMATAASCALLGRDPDATRASHVGAACVKLSDESDAVSILTTSHLKTGTTMAWNVDPEKATATHEGISIVPLEAADGAFVTLTPGVVLTHDVTICPGSMCDSSIPTTNPMHTGHIIPPPTPPKRVAPPPSEDCAGAGAGAGSSAGPSVLTELRAARQSKAKNHRELLSLQALPLYDHPEWKGVWVIPEATTSGDDGVYTPNPESTKTYNVLLATRIIATLVSSISAVGTDTARFAVVEAIFDKLAANTSLGAFRAGFPLALIVHLEWILGTDDATICSLPGSPVPVLRITQTSWANSVRRNAVRAWRTAIECIVAYSCTQAAKYSVSTPPLPSAGSLRPALQTRVSLDSADGMWTVKPWTLAKAVVASRRGVLAGGTLRIPMNAAVASPPAGDDWVQAVQSSTHDARPGGQLSDISNAMVAANMTWLDTFIASAPQHLSVGELHAATKIAQDSRDTSAALDSLMLRVLFTESGVERLCAPSADIVADDGVYGRAQMPFPTFASRAAPCVLATLLRAHNGAHPKYENRKMLVMEAARGNVVPRAATGRHAIGIIDFLDAAIERETRGRTTKLDHGMAASIGKMSVGPPGKRRGNSCKTVQGMNRVEGRPSCGKVCPFMNRAERRMNPFDVADALAKAVPGAKLEWTSIEAFTRKEWEDGGVGARLQAPGLDPVEVCRNTVWGFDAVGTKSAFPRDIPRILTESSSSS